MNVSKKKIREFEINEKVFSSKTIEANDSILSKTYLIFLNIDFQNTSLILNVCLSHN